jgi:tetratricopeptide (TPR) repeat protein
MRPQMHGGAVRARVGLYFAERRPERTPVLIRLGAQTIDIPAGVRDYVVSDSFDLPVAVDLLGVYPHAHYLAKTMEASAQLPSGELKTLLLIRNWDFNWQDSYTFTKPVQLPAGTQLRLRYVYDNSSDNPRNPHRPPRRVVYGPQSTDEMAELWIQSLAKEEGQTRILQRTLAMKSARDRVQGWQHLIRINAGDASAHAGLGAYYAATGDTAQAVMHYRDAIAAQPDFASAYYNLGLILEARGDVAAAVRHYQAALRARPTHAGAHNNLGNALRALGKLTEAMEHYRQSIALDSLRPEPHFNLAAAYALRGDFVAAVRYAEKARELALAEDDFRTASEISRRLQLFQQRRIQ